jgi:hypothetical protein
MPGVALTTTPFPNTPLHDAVHPTQDQRVTRSEPYSRVYGWTSRARRESYHGGPPHAHTPRTLALWRLHHEGLDVRKRGEHIVLHPAPATLVEYGEVLLRELNVVGWLMGASWLPCFSRRRASSGCTSFPDRYVSYDSPSPRYGRHAPDAGGPEFYLDNDGFYTEQKTREAVGFPDRHVPAPARGDGPYGCSRPTSTATPSSSVQPGRASPPCSNSRRAWPSRRNAAARSSTRTAICLSASPPGRCMRTSLTSLVSTSRGWNCCRDGTR